MAVQGTRVFGTSTLTSFFLAPEVAAWMIDRKLGKERKI